MGQWMVVVSTGRYRDQRLYQDEHVELPGHAEMAVDDRVLLVAPGPAAPLLFGVARVVAVDRSGADGGASVVAEYLRRRIDDPVRLPATRTADAGAGSARPGGGAGEVGRPVRLADAEFERLAQRLGRPAPAAPRREWMVGLDLPIEADSPAEAVRIFWSHVRRLGPAELPVFVWPRGDELAMRSYVLGTEHEMDPED